MRLGFHLSSEEHGASDLVEVGAFVESLGLPSVSVSDHFHPWGKRQGHSPFVWSTLAGLAATTSTLEMGPLVTCPIMRMHPAIVAHAAATTATMAPNRFFLSVGTGEWLNEHVVGDHWPSLSRRIEMLDEAVTVIRRLWSGKLISHHGTHYTVENARLFDVPEIMPPIFVAGSGEESISLAARVGDGLVLLAPSAESVGFFRSQGGADRPVVGMAHICIAASDEQAQETVRRWWPTAAVPSQLNAELSLPEHFEALAEAIPFEPSTSKTVIGSDVGRFVELVERYADAGFDQLWLHQIGPDQHSAARFIAERIVPALSVPHR
jgi:coenzyme F420-dependent glucose-6-phosphate dehydrogenase